MFRVDCLGAACVRTPKGERVHFRSRKHFALLVHLALSAPRAHRRERWVGLLWPEDGESRARHSLSQSLYALRGLLGENAVAVRGEELQLGSVPLAVDALEFERRLREGRLAEGVAIYRGEFLEGFWVRDAHPFEEWMDRERARFAAELRQALRTLIRQGRERGEWRKVLERSRRLISLEPYDEHAYADLLRALWIVGDRAGALKEYELLREVLAAELGSEPGEEIRELAATEIELPIALEAARIRRRAAAAKRKEEERRAETPKPEPPFLGRQEEYARLRESWERVKAGRAGGVVLTGEPGIGKTRLAEEFLRSVALEDARILRGACYPFLRGVPYAPIADALRTVVSHETFAGLEPRWRWQLFRLFPEWARESAFPEGGDEARRESNVRLQFEAVAQLFHGLASERPLVLLIDNLQWADAGSSSLAYFLLQRLPRLPIFLLATSREEAAGRWWSWPVDSDERVSGVRVPPMSREEVDGLVRAVSAIVPAEQVYVLSRGNPFFALELCRGEWPQEAGAEGWGDARGIVEKRLGLLESRDRRVLEMASVIGEPVPLHLLEATCGTRREILLEALDRLGQSGFLASAGEHLEFAHDLIHESVYGGLPEVRRRILHARVAAALEVRDRDAESRARQAWHYDRAGDRARAFAAGIANAREAKERYAYDQARALAEIAVRNASHPDERLEATHLVGEVLVHQRRYSAARPFLQDAKLLALEAGDHELQLKIQNLLWRTQLDSSDRPLEELLAEVERTMSEPWFDLVSTRTRMEFVVIFLGVAHRSGNLDAFQRGADLAEALAAGSNEPFEVRTALRARGVLETVLGRADRGLPLLERGVSIAQHRAA